jgi:hypothetical protein
MSLLSPLISNATKASSKVKMIFLALICSLIIGLKQSAKTVVKFWLHLYKSKNFVDLSTHLIVPFSANSALL